METQKAECPPEETGGTSPVTHLATALNTAVKLGRKLIRDSEVSRQLNKSPASVFWEAYFRVILMRVLGRQISPREGSPLENTLRSRLQEIDKRTGEEMHTAEQNFHNWARPPQKMWYWVAQFWNAEDERSSSFVVNGIPTDGRLIVSPENWDLMRKLNSLPVGSTTRVKVGAKDSSVEYPNSIGNFVMALSDHRKETCNIFQVTVGPDSSNPEFSKVRSPALAIPEAFVRSLELRLSHLLTIQDASNAFDRFWTQERKEQVELVQRLVSDSELWKEEYQRGFITYFKNEYDIGEGHELLSEGNLRLLILNNLLVVTNLLNLILANGDSKQWKSGWHCQYCIPVWHLSTSYIYITTSSPLSPDELSCFEIFAERIMAIAWAEDSVRKHEVDRTEILSRSRTAARASILARNFSHVIGSHIISNPDFAFELAGDEAWDSWRTQLAEHARKFDQVRQNYVMGKNVSAPSRYWREAERTLTQLTKAQLTGGTLLEQTRRFHHYLQGRFDFIARAIDQTHDRQEPVFFISDLLDGFLSQTAFLGTLVADLGVRLPNIQFKVILPDSEFEAKWTKVPQQEAEGDAALSKPGIWKHSWHPLKGPGNDIGNHDVLLGVPGGMISCHAFYSLLENIIRNSIKYGSDKNEILEPGKTYEMTLQLVEVWKDKDRYHLRIWDNCSGLGKDDKVYADLGKKLQFDVLNEKNGQTKEGLGIQEMILCAENLLSERARHELEEENRILQEQKKQEQKKALRLVEKEECSESKLTFEITLSKPVFVGIWTKAGSTKCQTGTVRRTDDMDSVINRFRDKQTAGFSAHIFVIDGDLEPTDEVSGELSSSVNKGVIAKLKVWHTLMPYRLVVVCKDEGRRKIWHRAILEAEKDDIHPLPAGRLRVVVDQVLQTWLSDVPLSESITNGDTAIDPGQSDDKKQAFVIACLNAWLRAWKGERKDGPWDLWLGFRREKVEDQWQPLLNAFEDYIRTTVFARYKVPQPNSVRVFARRGMAGDSPGPIVGSTSKPEDLRAYWTAELNAPVCEKKALVFDNHGECFPEVIEAEKEWDPRRSTRFYQRFSGDTADLYRLISNPPKRPFGFAYFVYSLVESCLANIAVVDERVAADLIFAQGRTDVACTRAEFSEKLASHQKAGVYPLFSFKPVAANGKLDRQSEQSSHGDFTPIHREALLKILPPGESGIPNLYCEGVQFDKNGNTTRAGSIVSKSEGGFDLLRLLATSEHEDCPVDDCPLQEQCIAIPLDAIVIHEGAVDLVANNEKVGWEKELTKKFWKIAPAVIRTSGRGRHTKHFDPRLPFIEFNEVSSALLTSRNKHSLVRGLFGASGRFDPQDSGKKALD